MGFTVISLNNTGLNKIERFFTVELLSFNMPKLIVSNKIRVLDQNPKYKIKIHESLLIHISD